MLLIQKDKLGVKMLKDKEVIKENVRKNTSPSDQNA